MIIQKIQKVEVVDSPVTPSQTETRRISWAAVLSCYRVQGIYISPLLEPISTIESRLRESRYLMDEEHLLRYDTNKEEFIVCEWKDSTIKAVSMNWRTRLANWIRPK